MLNINIGHNKELMEASHTLWEYAEYTGRVRKYAAGMPIWGNCRAGCYRMHRGRDPEGVSGEKPSGDEECEYIRI